MAVPVAVSSTAAGTGDVVGPKRQRAASAATAEEEEGKGQPCANIVTLSPLELPRTWVGFRVGVRVRVRVGVSVRVRLRVRLRVGAASHRREP